MSEATKTPAGLSVKEFKLYATEIGDWLLGTVQGAFNEKQTLSQIITDAIIGMIPLVGDVTAARDLIAVSMGLINHPEKRDNKIEWVLLVILIFALIPIIGGIIKGVGRLALKITETLAKDSKALITVANEIIGFLNRMGHMNAEAWIKSLNVMKYQSEILNKFRSFCDTIIICIHRYGLRFQNVLPKNLISRMEQLSHGFRQLRDIGEKMIPQALKELHEKLDQLQKIIHSGGVPPGKSEITLAQTGKKTVTYAEEARLIEGRTKKRIVRSGKYAQNLASNDPRLKNSIDKVYQYEFGYPNLLAYADPKGFYPKIASASGPIKNEELAGEFLFRSFGPAGSTRNVTVAQSYPTGAYWGIGRPPATGKEWRNSCAVLDEWNRNGWLTIIFIPSNIKTKIKACTSTVSEQFGKDIPGQFLEGGAKQAVIDAFSEQTFRDITADLYKKGGGKVTMTDGIVVEVRPSGWKNINGKVGYGKTAIQDASVVERLGVTEKQTKIATKVAQATAKQERQK